MNIHRRWIVRDCAQIGLTPTEWAGLNPDERLEKLQKLESKIAETEQRNCAIVCSYYSTDSGDLGRTVRDGSGQVYIGINDKLLSDRSKNGYLEAVLSLVHESHHAYQIDILSSESHNWHRNGEETINWFLNVNRDRYIPPDHDHERYKNQPLERTAFENEEKVKEVLCYEFGIEQKQQDAHKQEHKAELKSDNSQDGKQISKQDKQNQNSNQEQREEIRSERELIRQGKIKELEGQKQQLEKQIEQLKQKEQNQQRQHNKQGHSY